MSQIYLISPEKIEIKDFAKRLANALEAKQVAVFQLRLKNVEESFIIEACKVLIPICHKQGVQFILNDYIDIAAKVGVDGIHVGEEKDGTYDEARKKLGTNKIIGVSCYGDIDRAIDMAEKGADYVAFGAFYETTTKTPKARPEPAILKWWTTNSTVPCVAIGGINSQNCTPIKKAGADFIAVVSSIWNHKDGEAEAISQLYKAIENS